MGLISEFKAFIQRGNVVDLAVAVIMGTSFEKIVKSLVADVLMPPIGYIVGGTKFTELKYTLPKIAFSDPLDGSLKVIDPPTVNYGNFLQSTFDFLIVSICVFAMVKAMNSMKKKVDTAPPAPPEPTPTEILLTEIRDALKAR